MEDIIKEIKKYRKMFRLNQSTLAMYAGVSTKFISDLENNKKTIQLDKLIAVLNVFNLSLQVVPSKK
mgnify:CR=1 FL=1